MQISTVNSLFGPSQYLKTGNEDKSHNSPYTRGCSCRIRTDCGEKTYFPVFT